MSNRVESFAKASREVGKNLAYIQGPGGNTSIKDPESGLMHIKASGRLLKDMTPEAGFVSLPYEEGRKSFEQEWENDEAFNGHLRSLVVPGQEGRPSIETGFHLLFEDFVLHTHSVYVNVLTCAQEGQRLLKKHFPESAWVEYETPGLALTLMIKAALDANPGVRLLFLKNHGVVTQGATPEEAVKLHEQVNQRLRDSFQLPEFSLDVETIPVGKMASKVLFPDQIVYTKSGAELLATEAAKENLAAYAYIWKTQQMLGLTPSLINTDQQASVAGLETEKYRQSLQ